ncbi:PREDICTED: Krueppel-like factor 16 [Ficedula albicollis]|uniref:Krueppel-like factor 16 n=1 Tax=Ficedula albicollis TaxID=59894 RepID=UPI000359C6F0|nr:PREDICTED: Krueppel-like factor 16 [Ficedula albicollis]
MRNKRTWPAVFRGAGAGCPPWPPEPLDPGRGPAELQWTLLAAERSIPAAAEEGELPARSRPAARPSPGEGPGVSSSASLRSPRAVPAGRPHRNSLDASEVSAGSIW